MRRADRLFRIVQRMRRSQLVTARQLADELEVSERTIYRDVRDLSASGVPVESEAGVGYRLRGYDLPPLMFSRDQIEALVLGARIVNTWTDPELGKAARAALAKIEAVLPDGRESMVNETRLFAPLAAQRPRIEIDFTALRRTIGDRRKVRLTYADAEGRKSHRTVRPLALAFFGPTWGLIAWCELRRAFRSFRPDRIQEMTVLEEGFTSAPGERFQDFVRLMEQEEC